MRGALRAMLLFAAFAASPAAHASAIGFDDIVVHVTMEGNVISVEVVCPIEGGRAVAWDVLTDYDHMALFLSNVEYSHVEKRAGGLLQVRQKVNAWRGPMSPRFESVREVRLEPQTAIHSRLLTGHLKDSTFATRIAEGAGGLSIEHSGRYTADLWLPPFVGPALMEAETRRQYGELRAEIRRRNAAAR
jgi:hypothetical protein